MSIINPFDNKKEGLIKAVQIPSEEPVKVINKNNKQDRTPSGKAAVMAEFNYIESDIPVGSPYWQMKH